MTQEEVAEGIGMTRKGYSHIETGRRNPSWETQKSLERFFGVPISYLLDESEDDQLFPKQTATKSS